MKISLLCVTLQYLALPLIINCHNETTACPAEWMEFAPDQCFCNFHEAAKCSGASLQPGIRIPIEDLVARLAGPVSNKLILRGPLKTS